MEDDCRLIFISNLDNYFNDSKEYEEEVFEYEVYSDVSTAGGLVYGPYSLRVWEIGRHEDGQETRLNLRVHVKIPVEDLGDAGNYRPDYFFSYGNQIAKEMIYLSSLFTRRRLRFAGIVRRDDTPLMLKPGIVNSGWIDHELVEGPLRFDEFEEHFKSFRKLKPVNQQLFLQAAMLYNQAIQEIEAMPVFAYLSLVSSIESISTGYEIGEVDLHEIDLGLSNAVKRIDDETLRNDISNRIVKILPMTKRRFVRFIMDHMDDTFWEHSNRPEREVWGDMGRIRPEDIKNYLTNIYIKRSKYLHVGEPFPLFSISVPMIKYSDIQPGIDEKKEFIPNIQFFERLVRHVLLSYLNRHSATG